MTPAIPVPVSGIVSGGAWRFQPMGEQLSELHIWDGSFHL